MNQRAGGAEGQGATPPARPATRTTVVLALAIVAALSVVALTALQPRGSSEAGSSPATSVASPTTSPTTAPVATPGPTPVVTPQPTPELAVDPLTGLLVSPADDGNPVVAVMIDDLAPARPQSGFNSAGIVWQAPAEGGIPRYMMVFHATVPAAVGPVRSSREYFIEWASEWRAMYVHAGGSPQALATLRTRGSGQWVWNADEFRWGTYFWRVTSNVAPHNLYSDGPHLFALAHRIGASQPAAPIWTFAADAPVQQRPTGGSIQVVYPYESILYRYDRVTNTYTRSINGSKTAQADAADGQLVAPKNVVILRMAFGPLNDSNPKKHRLEASDVGRGVAWISTNGVTVKGTWRKASVTAPTLLFGPDGSPVTLTAGQTFVQVMTLTDPIIVKAGAFSPPPAIRPASLLPL